MELRLNKFAKFAWFVLAYNLVTVLWGVFLRASHSGDGCGQYWLTCNGEIVPAAPQFKTVIEFSHRLMTGLDFFIVLALLIWALKKFRWGDLIGKLAAASFFFIIVEALIGAGLVLTGNTAGADTPSRPFWTAGHLITTFLLLAALSLTAWMAGLKERPSFHASRGVVIMLAVGLCGIVLVGMSGSLAALSSMLFPSGSLIEGIAKDFAEGARLILRLRISHPILSLLMGAYLIYLALRLKRSAPEDPAVIKWANILCVLVITQLFSGFLTLITLAPIVMQIMHLLLADLLWISFILLAASYIARERALK